VPLPAASDRFARGRRPSIFPKPKMSPYRTWNKGIEATEKDESSRAASGCKYLPPRGYERTAYLVLVALLMALKVVAIYRYRSDPDETQHAHVVWGWATGRLQYRDLFDNHMPLFQMLCAPLMRLLGERADIVILLRWAMTPLYLACLWCVFRLAEMLYGRRIAPWACLAAAALPKFFYTSTEFRPDDLWAFFWLLALLVAVSGRFTLRRALGFGLLLGLTFAVSMKTVVLLGALLAALLVALPLAWMRRDGPGAGAVAGSVGVILAGAVIAPAAMVYYFASRQAFWIMYYCVVSHNVVPGMKRWGHFSSHLFIFPAALAALAAYACLTFRQTPDTRLAIRRTIILLTPWLFLCLLLSYWPDITREDDLPYTPLTPLLAAPVLLWAARRFKLPRVKARFFTWILPALCFAELLWVWNANTLRSDRMKVTTRSIHDVLLLTSPSDYVMDGRGDYVFRMRPDYWVFETITKARVRLGLIKDDLVAKLEKTETPMCYLFSAHVLTDATRFIFANYMPFDPAALDLAVAGKELGAPSPDGTYSFDVAISQTYAVVSETGVTAGTLDGLPYTGPVRLAAGHHLFHRTAGGGRAAILLARAVAEGFQPQYDASEKLARAGGKEKDL